MILDGIFSKKALVCFAGAIALLGVAYASLMAIGLAPSPYARMTATEEKITNLSGGDLEITETSIDSFAKEEFISIYISKAGVKGESLVAKWFRKRTLLFRYDPA